MSFTNCMLEESERREYWVTQIGKMVKFEGGTIDRDRDIRLHMCYNGPVREMSDEYTFIFDYKGKIMTPVLKQEIKKNNIYWYSVTLDKIDHDETILHAFREAIVAYAVEGYIGVFTKINTKCENVYIQF